ncbi:WXG100 family type VII secretion target [Mycolicibacterium diernhoferi]|uniref:ESAT-6-like protein n=1 Tax=Mycolicibacterium diernhoferi TaxID=1801 RepID=A0A1Q4H9B3_9MYCO|nr:WXG100 family type VII secretion target [Mycolicibacterium diernhoferi]OJZ64045.1 hypothetical protein BRW64_20180 [Mycolicibacterium diernhoferi]OPE54523.1 hypothetical protein BV510_09820 [Mycolicibacterium diernhoferi]PEG55568.1 hypothetical protein CRI78_04695 [Mycolicibacterium diernhoferi]QYL20736.1 WXG100 family type VII secretion target [Mycolicibacterium diernhoferi]
MPQSLKLDPTRIQASAGELEMVNSSARDQLARNAEALVEAQSGWVGTAFGAFEQLRETWERTDAARAGRLDEIAISFRRSAALYQATDEANAGAFDSAV